MIDNSVLLDQKAGQTIHMAAGCARAREKSVRLLTEIPTEIATRASHARRAINLRDDQNEAIMILLPWISDTGSFHEPMASPEPC
ncbi:hypothetical protein RRG08_057559 [Elysia crispata]|uniref:Uncharacterized protein n=1 Tax=Elysia crispata TaxID=231223 RepID=A0AAE1CJF5_9GAST|nr:hypothetical protein RRG08_057559 [Elysia crispata]